MREFVDVCELTVRVLLNGRGIDGGGRENRTYSMFLGRAWLCRRGQGTGMKVETWEVEGWEGVQAYCLYNPSDAMVDSCTREQRKEFETKKRIDLLVVVRSCYR